MKRYFKYCKKQEDLEKYIVFLAEDLKRRKKEISVDWDKAVKSIELNAKICPEEVLGWQIIKSYNAFKEKED